MKLKTAFTVLILCTSIVKSDATVTCSAPSVKRGDNGTITCVFKKDIKKINIIVYHYNKTTNAKASDVLNWFPSDTLEPECTEKPGYRCSGHNKTSLSLNILAATEKHEGKYICQEVPSNPGDAEPCTFTLKDTGLETFTRSIEDQIVDKQTEEKGSNVALISIPVALVVLLGIAVVVVLIFRKKRLIRWYRNHKRRKSSRQDNMSHSNSHGSAVEGAENIPLNSEDDLEKDFIDMVPRVPNDTLNLATAMSYDIKKAAHERVTDGMSLTDTTIGKLMNTECDVTAGVVIENWTNTHLLEPAIKANNGNVTLPARDIAPATREVLVARGVGLVGTSGTASWTLENLNRKVFIMWSVPRNQHVFRNYLAVGVSVEGCDKHYSNAFNVMYEKESSKDIYFARKEFQTSQFPVIFRDGKIEIEGKMGDDRHPQIEIIVRPVNPENLAEPIKSTLLQQLQGNKSAANATHPCVVDGSSLADTSITDLMSKARCEVTVGFVIENWTTYNLLNTSVKPVGGVVFQKPCSIAPATREAMVMCKEDGSLSGSWGTVSWTLENCDRLMFVMWSVPANQTLFENRLAVGVSRKGYHTHAEPAKEFDRMYKKESSKKVYFSRKEFHTNQLPVVFRNDKIEIEGTMDDGRQPTIKIVIRPMDP